jgi:protein arginine N-methyltransferase 2
MMMETKKGQGNKKRTKKTNLDPFHRPKDATQEVPYLQQSNLEFKEDILFDESGFAVMMEWERPLMQAHASFVCSAGNTVLNVGFGMGIVDTAIQKRNPAKHVIVEGHPKVFARAQAWSKGRSNVVVIHSQWQDVDLKEHGPFDGIFWDTYEETVEDFFPLLENVLRKGGRLSFCNMYVVYCILYFPSTHSICRFCRYQPHCAMRNVAYSLYLQTRLAEFGVSCSYCIMPCHVTVKEWSSANPYWEQNAYLVPHCVFDLVEGEQRDVAKHEETVFAVKRKYADGSPLKKLLWRSKLWLVHNILTSSSAAHDKVESSLEAEPRSQGLVAAKGSMPVGSCTTEAITATESHGSGRSTMGFLSCACEDSGCPVCSAGIGAAIGTGENYCGVGSLLDVWEAYVQSLASTAAPKIL